MNEVRVPDEVDFNNSEIAAANKRRTFAPTGEKRRVRFVVSAADRQVAKEKGTMMIVLTCSPLKDPDNADSKGSPTIRHSLILPKANKDFDGHRAPNTAGLCHSYYRAVMEDDMPDYPRFDRDANSYTYNGEEIERDENEVYRLEVTGAVTAQLAKDWGTPGNRIDDCFYAEVVDNKGFANLRNLTSDLPEDCELVPENEWVAGSATDDDDDDEETEAEEKPISKKNSSKPSSARPAPKAPAKKPIKKKK